MKHVTSTENGKLNKHYGPNTSSGNVSPKRKSQYDRTVQNGQKMCYVHITYLY